jgi:predicted nuclease with TOPRIM domain
MIGYNDDMDNEFVKAYSKEQQNKDYKSRDVYRMSDRIDILSAENADLTNKLKKERAKSKKLRAELNKIKEGAVVKDGEIVSASNRLEAVG